MAYSAVTIAAGSGDSVTQALTKLYDNTEALRTLHIGSSAPAVTDNGQVWVDNTSSTQYVVKLRQNGAWVVLTDKIAEGDRDFDANEAQNMKLHQLATGSLPTTEALVWYDTTVDQHGGTSSSSAKRYWAFANTDASSVVQIPCSLNVTNAGTPATANTDTDLGGWQMDAATEELNIIAERPIPNGWTGADDLTLRVRCLLLNAETASDTIDLDGTWISMTPGSGDGPGKSATAFAAASQDISTGNAQYDLHTVSLTVDHDDATNPVAVGDVWKATVLHDPAAGGAPVAGIIVIGATLEVPVFNYNH